VSKTSQKNKEVQKAMKGKAEAKASKNGAKAAGRPRTAQQEQAPIPAHYSGVATKLGTVRDGKQDSLGHMAENGVTLCGRPIELTEDMKKHNVVWAFNLKEVTCVRCLTAIEKSKEEAKPKAEKKATPKKSKKELATANA
jgi:hypothetical protein